jgi:hypothetical protein
MHPVERDMYRYRFLSSLRGRFIYVYNLGIVIRHGFEDDAFASLNA